MHAPRFAERPRRSAEKAQAPEYDTQIAPWQKASTGTPDAHRASSAPTESSRAQVTQVLIRGTFLEGLTLAYVLFC